MSDLNLTNEISQRDRKIRSASQDYIFKSIESFFMEAVINSVNIFYRNFSLLLSFFYFNTF